MELSEVTGTLYRMREMVELALRKLDEGVRQTHENEGKIYWLNVNIQNNSQKFTKEEIDKAGRLEAELKQVADSYREMSVMAKEILLEIDTYIDKAKELDNSNDVECETELDEKMGINILSRKIRLCLNESQRCLNMQTELLDDEKQFDVSLRKRLEGRNEWFVKLKGLLRGVHI
jgi:hypothetical protein